MGCPVGETPGGPVAGAAALRGAGGPGGAPAGPATGSARAGAAHRRSGSPGRQPGPHPGRDPQVQPGRRLTRREYPVMHILTTTHLRGPIEEVFDFLTTPANWPRWHPSSLKVTGAADHP